MISVRCDRCREKFEVKETDPRFPNGTFLCPDCAGSNHAEGAPGIPDDELAAVTVEIEELGADGGVLGAKVPFG